MTISRKADRMGGVLVYLLMSWFAWHTAIICVAPMAGVESSVLHLIFGEWPGAPYAYIGGLIVCVVLVVAMIIGRSGLASLAIMLYATGMGTIAILSGVGGLPQIALLYSGFVVIAIVSAAVLQVHGGDEYGE